MKNRFAVAVVRGITFGTGCIFSHPAFGASVSSFFRVVMIGVCGNWSSVSFADESPRRNGRNRSRQEDEK